ncbi:MAG: hypothetical protein WBM52_19320, partial [Thiogranum sp.]
QTAVLSFAEFLLSRAPTAKAVPAVAVDIPEPELGARPQDEKVVAGIKRLSKVYYMLDKSKMLGVTSDLVTQHILQGREAVAVIDELEQVFADHYRQLKQGDGEKS